MHVDKGRLLASFAAKHHAIFSLRHAQMIGFTEEEARHRRSSGRWVSIYDDVYRVAGAPPTWKGLLLAACWAGGFRAAASHRSGAAVWGLAGARREIPEITCPRWLRARHGGVVVHETNAIGPLDITTRDGIPVTTVERTLLDLAAVCHESIVEMALDAAEKRDLVSLDSVAATLGRLARPGRRGVRTLRILLDRHANRLRPPESEMETRMLQVIRRHGLPDPVPQFEIWHEGVLIARVDAAYPQWRIAIEYDSVQEHAGRLAHERDIDRRLKVIAAEWISVPATAKNLRGDGNEFIAAIRAARRAS